MSPNKKRSVLITTRDIKNVLIINLPRIGDFYMTIPTNEDILRILTELETKTADSLESQWFEFKPWHSPKDDMKVAVEQAVCFANGEGGCIVFGVADFVVGRDF